MLFSEKLKTARTTCGLSQRQLTELSGVAQPQIASYETGRVVPLPETQEKLLAATRQKPSLAFAVHRAEVLAKLAEYGVTNVRLFGSVARLEDKPGSDIDFLATFPRPFGMIQLSNLHLDLEDILGVPVDIVSDSGSARVLANARRDAVAL